MGIGRIIQDHRPAPTSASEEKAVKQKQDEILKELVPEQPKEKRPVGRPRKNSADGPVPATPNTPQRASSKSPSRRAAGVDLPQVPPTTGTDHPQVTAEEAARQIGNRAVIRQLRAYCRRFPEFAPPPGYNPHLYTPEQNRLVIEEIKEAVRSEIEYLTAPSLVSDSIVQAEMAATAWAMQQNADNPMAKAVGNLQSASTAILSDKAINLDLGLLECEISGFLPKNPYLRLGINVCRVLVNVWNKNKQATVVPPEHKKSEFKEF